MKNYLDILKFLLKRNHCNIVLNMNSLKILSQIEKNSKILNILNLIDCFDKIVNIIIKFYQNIKGLKETLHIYKEKFFNFKTIVFNMINHKNIFYFKSYDQDTVKTWIINHALNLKTNNIFSYKDESCIMSYKQNKNIQELLITEPKTRGYIYLENTKITYILTNDNISLFHFNKIILNKVLQNLIEFINNNVDLTDTNTTPYYPKIFQYKINPSKKNNQMSYDETGENNNIISYKWHLENTIFEDVKIFFKKNDKEKLLSPFDDFFNRPELYKKIGLSYKMVSCFSGNPGLGKTTTIKFLAKKYTKDIYIFNNLDMNTNDFLHLYRQIPTNSIILFDDFDKLPYYPTTFTNTLLNILDGVLTKHGSLIIFCLNKDNFLERKFPTITRIGRIDHFVDFNLFDPNIIEEVIREIYVTYTEEEIQEYIKLIQNEEKIPQVSELKNKCLHASGDLTKAIQILKES